MKLPVLLGPFTVTALFAGCAAPPPMRLSDLKTCPPASATGGRSQATASTTPDIRVTFTPGGLPAPEATQTQIPVVDLAPSVPMDDKSGVIIRHADGSVTQFMVDGEARGDGRLPRGDCLLSLLPPLSMVGHQPSLATDAPKKP
jgi:hypothetical protein